MLRRQINVRGPMGRSIVRVVIAGLSTLAAACSGSLAFSDTSPLVVVGTPPPPPPPPEPPPPPPPPPPAAPKRVELTQDQIVIHDKIQFETNKAVIKPESFGLLDEITAAVKEASQIKKLSIEGHTDDVGADKYNLKLSEQRAASVKQYLVEHGIDAARLASKGWGEAKPIGDNKTEEGKEQNRRVEFIIVEQDVVKKTYEIDPATGEKREVRDARDVRDVKEPAK
jgi:outer membrane protein OmpA-like peptidoglycan-associated protein